ncbi:MAG: peptide chain release factor N(5)-glutamine methyltransferase [Bacteroidetes bacterium]|nr:peptide chain release factor N(5)-glutamine methyltransferase [Bacteroidota bacterium]MCL2301729.1 peptide chain release factor N(5)-glutamine methyltransferase [Lentimicrobiaceae bacterium]
MKISTLREFFHSKLSSLYDKREIDAIFFVYIENKFDIKKHQYFLDPELRLSDERCAISGDLEALANGAPIQYVIGKAIFYNLQLNVNSSVLIPRPETEELIAVILKGERRREKEEGRESPANFEEVPGKAGRGNLYKILDLATGSGAIAIALAKNLKNVAIWATDISKDALETAKKNAVHHNVKITFLHHNILEDNIVLLPNNLDVIVSNPPYIPQSERSNLHKNVTDYEPDMALFVPDENPLIFYEKIAYIAKKLLREGGVLYFETHEKFHSELSAMLARTGFKEIEPWNDINDKPRFISCKKL